MGETFSESFLESFLESLLESLLELGGETRGVGFVMQQSLAEIVSMKAARTCNCGGFAWMLCGALFLILWIQADDL